MPLLYANMAGLAAGSAWLGAMAQWQLVGLGVAVIFISPYIIPILLMPAGIFSHFMLLYQKAGRRKFERLMFVLSIFYIALFMTLWCVGIFEYATGDIGPEIPLAPLLWAASAAMLPLLMWSSRDRSNILIMAMVEVAQAATLILCTIRFFGVIPHFWLSSAVFGGFLALLTIMQAVNEEKSMNTR